MALGFYRKAGMNILLYSPDNGVTRNFMPHSLYKRAENVGRLTGPKHWKESISLAMASKQPAVTGLCRTCDIGRDRLIKCVVGQKGCCSSALSRFYTPSDASMTPGDYLASFWFGRLLTEDYVILR